MTLSPVGLNLIRQCEGFRSKPYRCPGGDATIGFGHVLRPGETFESISRRDAEQLLLKDIALVTLALRRLIVVPLHQHQWDSLISFTFNIGSGAFQRSRLRQCVNRSHHAYVPAELMRWTRAGSKILPGLLQRRRLEARLYQGLWG